MTGWAKSFGARRGQLAQQGVWAALLGLGLMTGCSDYQPAPLPPGTTVDASNPSADSATSAAPAASGGSSSSSTTAAQAETATPPASTTGTLETASTFKPKSAEQEAENPAPSAPQKQPKPQASGEIITTFPRSKPQIVLPYTPSPFLAIDNAVFDGRNRQEVGTAALLENNFGQPQPALSPDGQFFAFSKQIDAQGERQWSVDVLDTTTGKLLHTFPVVEKDGHWQKIEFLAFTKHNNLLAIVGGHRGGSLWLWDVTKGKRLRKYPAAALKEPIALAEDGSRIVANVSGAASIFDMVKGKVAGQLVPPPSSSGSGSITKIAFSPDGKEIAGLCRADSTSILAVWNADGRVLEEIPLPGLNISTKSFSWLRDGSGWLVDSSLVSRETRAVVWRVEANRATPAGLFNDDSLLLYSDFFEPRQVVAIEIPQQKIKQAVAAVAGEKRVLGPGDNVAIKIAIGDVRFADKAQVETALGDAISKRLEKMGFKFGEPARATFLVSYAEKPGRKMNKPGMSAEDVYKDEHQIAHEIRFGGQEVLKKYEAMGIAKQTGDGGIFIHFEVKRGRHLIQKGVGESALVESTASTCDLSIFKEGADKPAWATRLTSNMSPSEKSTDPQSLRQRTFDYILSSMGREELPTYVSEVPDAPQLPVVENAAFYFGG